MITLTVIERNSELVVDSRLVAESLGIDHHNFLQTIRTYQETIESAFEGILFETEVPKNPTGNPPKYALLNENQATFLMTLSRNTPEVIKAKLGLVTAFSKAKEIIGAKPSDRQTPSLVDILKDRVDKQYQYAISL